MITDKHRLFYVNGKLEFALFYDKSVTDKEKIKENFLKDRDWLSFERYNQIKTIKSFEVSDDLKEVRIEARLNKRF